MSDWEQVYVFVWLAICLIAIPAIVFLNGAGRLSDTDTAGAALSIVFAGPIWPFSVIAGPLCIMGAFIGWRIHKAGENWAARAAAIAKLESEG